MFRIRGRITRQMEAVFGEGAIPSPVAAIMRERDRLGVTPAVVSEELGRLGAEMIRRDAAFFATSLLARRLPVGGDPDAVLASLEGSARPTRRWHPLFHEPYPDPPTLELKIRQSEVTTALEPRNAFRWGPRGELYGAFRRGVRPRRFQPHAELQRLWEEHTSSMNPEFRELRQTLGGEGFEQRDFDQLWSTLDSQTFKLISEVRESRGRERQVLKENNGLLFLASVYRLLIELFTERFVSQAQMPLREPIGHLHPSEVTPYSYQDCFAYLFGLLAADEQIKKAGLSLADRRFCSSYHIIRTLWDHFQILPPEEPLQINDAVLYHRDLSNPMEGFGPLHVGRVVSLLGGEVWVESKWGYFKRPLIHRLEEVPSDQFGEIYFAARVKGASPRGPTSSRNFAAAGYRIPRPIRWQIEDVITRAIGLKASILAAEEGQFFQRF